MVLLGAGAAAARAERANAEMTVLELTILTDRVRKSQMNVNDCDDDEEKKESIDRVNLTRYLYLLITRIV